jgi:uncharacterized protein (DUF433 family)
MLPSVSLTPAEVSALLHLPERQVRKEIEYRILDVPSPPRISFDGLVYLSALAALDALNPSVEWRRSFYARIRTALTTQSRVNTEISLGESGEPSVFRFQLRAVVDAVSNRLDAFDRWKAKRVTSSPSILGGEPTFHGTRLAVRQIGDRAARESAAAILEDYPYLSTDDVMFAVQFAHAYPRPGRPRDPS